MLSLAQIYPNNSCFFYSLRITFPRFVRFARLKRISPLLRIYQNISRGSVLGVQACISAAERFRELLVNMHHSTKRVPPVLLCLSRIILDLGPLDDSLDRSVKSKYVAVCNWQRMQPRRANWRRWQIRQPPTTPTPEQRKRNCRRLFALSAPLFPAAQLIRVPLVFWRTPPTLSRYRQVFETGATATATQIKERPNAAREIKRSMASLHRRALISPAVCIPRSRSSCLYDRRQWNTFARIHVEIKKINLIPKLDRIISLGM